VETEALNLSGELSPIQLFFEADIVVKGVVVLLLLLSVWSWTVIVQKFLAFMATNRLADQFEGNFWSGGNLEELYDQIAQSPKQDPMSAVFASGMREWRRAPTSKLNTGTEGLKASLRQRIDRAMDLSIGKQLARLENQLTILASIGQAAPFIGLFGTVWGVIDAFQTIAAEGSTSLVAVAPPIAEALFATALGLVAAIPASIAYNKFSSDLGKFGDRLDTFSGEFGAILSRQLDRRD